MVNTMRVLKIILLIIISILCIFGISACSKDNSIVDTSNTGIKTNFNYPEKSEFVFEVSQENFSVRSGEVMTIDCSLKNISDRDYYIQHGVETITYSYNDLGEVMDAIAILENFKSNSEYNRTLEITANKSGKITVSATIYVKPSQYSDEYETYTYEKDIAVDVVE